MQDFRSRQLTIVLFLTVSTIAVWQYSVIVSDQGSKNILEEIPLTIERWVGQDVSFKEKTFDILETPSVIVREYENNNQERVTLAIVYHENNESTFHQPEACLGGIGYTIVDEGIKKIQLVDSEFDSLSVRSLHYNRNNSDELIYYFYQTGNFVAANYLRFRWQMLLNQLRFRKTGGALIRVSTPLNQGHSPERILEEFISRISPYIYQHLKIETH